MLKRFRNQWNLFAYSWRVIGAGTVVRNAVRWCASSAPANDQVPQKRRASEG